MKTRTPVDTRVADSDVFARSYTRYLVHLLETLDIDAVHDFIEELFAARAAGGTIYFLGNGGSASTASHFACDLVMAASTCGEPFKAVSLSANTAIMTAIANDHGYDAVFSKQLEIQLRPNDLVVAISASGNSPNLAKAVAFARTRGNRTFAVVGFDGGLLRTLSDQTLHVPTQVGEYGPVEDIHLMLNHLVASYIRQSVLVRDTQRPTHFRIDGQPKKKLLDL